MKLALVSIFVVGAFPVLVLVAAILAQSGGDLAFALLRWAAAAEAPAGLFGYQILLP